MKKGVFKVVAVFLTLSVLFGCVLSVSAAKYPTNLISEQDGYSQFKQPGDVDGNGIIDANDFNAIKKALIDVAPLEKVLWDINGDKKTDIRDLVSQDEQGDNFLNDTKIVFNGRSVYHGELKLISGAEYEISNLGSAELDFKINDSTVVINNGKFKTPLTIKEVELSLIGKDITVENFEISRVNMDNDVTVG